MNILQTLSFINSKVLFFLKRLKYVLFNLNNRAKLLIPIVFLISIYTYILLTFFKTKANYGIRFNYNDYKNNTNTTKEKSPWLLAIAKAIKIVSKITPWTNVCRHQALQGVILCRFFKIPYLVFIGFKKDSKNQKIEGHAWVTCQELIITGHCNPETYNIHSVFTPN